MDYKEEIKKVLNDLKKIGWDRRKIEAELKYAEKSIDQVLARGGNEVMLTRLQQLYIAKVNPKSAIDANKDEKIIALQITVKILMKEVERLRAEVFKESTTIISLEYERLITEEIKRLQAGS